MSINGDVSEQIVRLTLEGFEVIAKLTGSGAKNIAAMLYAIMKDKNNSQTRGKMKLNKMLQARKPLKIFTISNEDLKIFVREAKNYGITYCALKDKKNIELDSMVDIIVKEEDASRINRIVEKFKLTTINTTKMETEVTKSIKDKEIQKKEKGVQEKSKEQQLKEVLTPKISQDGSNVQENFNLAKIEKSPLSKPSLMSLKMQEGVSKEVKKPSVKKELAELKAVAENLDNLKSKDKNNIISKTPGLKKIKSKTKSNR